MWSLKTLLNILTCISFLHSFVSSLRGKFPCKLDGHTLLLHINCGFCPYFLTLSYNTLNDPNHKWNCHIVYNALANSHESAKKTGNFCISFSMLFSHKQTLLPLHVRKRQKSKLNMHAAHNICTKVRSFGNCKVSASQWNANITSTADAVYTPAATRKLD